MASKKGVKLWQRSRTRRRMCYNTDNRKRNDRMKQTTLCYIERYNQYLMLHRTK